MDVTSFTNLSLQPTHKRSDSGIFSPVSEKALTFGVYGDISPVSSPECYIQEAVSQSGDTDTDSGNECDTPISDRGINFSSDGDDSGDEAGLKIDFDHQGDLGFLLGKGAFGQVKKVPLVGGKVVACKVPKDETGAKKLLDEHAYMRMVQECRYFPKLYGWVHWEGYDCLAMELLGVDLDRVFVMLGDQACYDGLSMDEYWGVIRTLMADVFKGADYLGQRNIVHSDLKPANTLVRQGSMEAVITDFGSASMRGESCKDGTIHYLPPETVAIQTKKAVVKADPKQDAYSLGQFLFQMSERDEDGEATFFSMGPPGNCQLSGFSRGQFPSLFAIGTNAPMYQELEDGKYKVALTTDPETMPEVCLRPEDPQEHEEYVNLVNGLLCPGPDKRMTPRKALEHPFMKRQVSDGQAREKLSEIVNQKNAGR